MVKVPLQLFCFNYGLHWLQVGEKNEVRMHLIVGFISKAGQIINPNPLARPQGK